MNVVVARHLSLAAALVAVGCGQPASSTSMSGLGANTAGSVATARSGAGGAAGLGVSSAASGAGAGSSGTSALPAPVVAGPPVLPAPDADEFPNVDCRAIQAEAPGAELGAAPIAPMAGASAAGSMAAGSMAAGGGGKSGGAAGAGTAGAAGGSGAAPAAGGAAPTLDDVAMVLRCEGCDSSFCHGGVAGFKVSSTRSELYEMLLGPDLGGAPTGTAESGGQCSGMKRVVPGDPEHSVLYLKLAQRQPCGAAMPPSGEARVISGFFNARELEVVRAWIAAGAKK